MDVAQRLLLAFEKEGYLVSSVDADSSLTQPTGIPVNQVSSFQQDLSANAGTPSPSQRSSSSPGASDTESQNAVPLQRNAQGKRNGERQTVSPNDRERRQEAPSLVPFDGIITYRKLPPGREMQHRQGCPCCVRSKMDTPLRRSAVALSPNLTAENDNSNAIDPTLTDTASSSNTRSGTSESPRPTSTNTMDTATSPPRYDASQQGPKKRTNPAEHEDSPSRDFDEQLREEGYLTNGFNDPGYGINRQIPSHHRQSFEQGCRKFRQHYPYPQTIGVSSNLLPELTGPGSITSLQDVVVSLLPQQILPGTAADPQQIGTNVVPENLDWSPFATQLDEYHRPASGSPASNIDDLQQATVHPEYFLMDHNAPPSNHFHQSVDMSRAQGSYLGYQTGSFVSGKCVHPAGVTLGRQPLRPNPFARPGLGMQ